MPHDSLITWQTWGHVTIWKIFASTKARLSADIYLFKVNNIDTKKRLKICSKLTTATPEKRQWLLSRDFIVKSEHIAHLFLAFLLLNFNSWMLAGLTASKPDRVLTYGRRFSTQMIKSSPTTCCFSSFQALFLDGVAKDFCECVIFCYPRRVWLLLPCIFGHTGKCFRLCSIYYYFNMHYLACLQLFLSY